MPITTVMSPVTDVSTHVTTVREQPERLCAGQRDSSADPNQEHFKVGLEHAQEVEARSASP